METRVEQPGQRHFCLSGKGHVKTLRLVLTVISMTFFIIAQAPEPYIVVTGFEVAVSLFFIILYSLRLDQLMKWLFWPLLDIINSAVAALFIIIVSVLALIPDTTKWTIFGGVFGLVAAAFYITDAIIIYQKLLFNSKSPYQKKPTQDRKEAL